MLLLASYDIVFQEVPGETTLALNLAGCPNACPGCHSPHLREATGEPLSDELLDGLLARYGDAVTCVAFMGGDACPAEVNRLAARVKTGALQTSAVSKTTPAIPPLKTAWYSGRDRLPASIILSNFDFIKLGPYSESLGPLGSPTSNQKFFRIVGDQMIDQTVSFRK